MKRLLFIFLVFLVSAISCKKQAEKIIVKTKIQDTIKVKSKLNKKRIKLLSNTKKELNNWKEYQLVDEILSKFYTISTEEALNNAKELSELVTHLKDSITDKRLKSPPLKSRINVLHNECLRLNDMTNIPAISPKEVTAEINNILNAYNAFNAKLNAVFSVRNLENELELDPDFEKILNDSLRVETPKKVKPPIVKKRTINRPNLDLIKQKNRKTIQ